MTCFILGMGDLIAYATISVLISLIVIRYTNRTRYYRKFEKNKWINGKFCFEKIEALTGWIGRTA